MMIIQHLDAEAQIQQQLHLQLCFMLMLVKSIPMLMVFILLTQGLCRLHESLSLSHMMRCLIWLRLAQEYCTAAVLSLQKNTEYSLLCALV